MERFPVDFWWYNAKMCVDLICSLGNEGFFAVGTSGGEIQEWIKGNEQMTKDQVAFWQQAHGDDWEHIIKLDAILMSEVVDKNLYKNSLDKVISPVLLTASLADDCITNIGLKMCQVAQKIKSAKTVFFSEGGHPLMWSKPEEFQMEVMRFINDNSHIKLQK